jgi:hypothetical protein
MPFPLSSLVPLSLTLKEVCLGLVELAFPDSRPSVRDDYRTAVHGREQISDVSNKETQMWAHLFKVYNVSFVAISELICHFTLSRATSVYFISPQLHYYHFFCVRFSLNKLTQMTVLLAWIWEVWFDLWPGCWWIVPSEFWIKCWYWRSYIMYTQHRNPRTLPI